jgi:hypothetical protein
LEGSLKSNGIRQHEQVVRVNVDRIHMKVLNVKLNNKQEDQIKIEQSVIKNITQRKG